MLKKETLSFLELLQSNNNKQWFQQNIGHYHAAKDDFQNFVRQLIVGIDDFDFHLEGLTAEECIFRIYRDNRHSDYTEPYKSHLGAYIAFGGRNSEYAGYYVHIAHNDCYVGGGMYNPGIAVLRKIRQEIDYNSQPLIKIIQSQEFREYFGDIQGDKLQSAPKGFPKDHKDIELLKLKSFFAIHRLSDEQLTSEGAVGHILTVFSSLYNFNKFFNETFVS